MKRITVTIILFSFFSFGFCQNSNIRLTEYLYPRGDTMKFNCTYNSFHANGLHDTINLVFKKLNIENTIAYCISRTDDVDCRYSELGSFLGSAMLFRNDSILLAPIQWDKSASKIRLEDFQYFIPPTLRKTDTVLIKLHDRNIKLTGFINKTLAIQGDKLKNCLKIKIIEEYKGVTYPQYGYVWLNKIYGILKWIRVTNRIELRDLTSSPSSVTHK